MAEPSRLSGVGAARSRGRRIALYLGALPVSAVLAGVIAAVSPQVRPALIASIAGLCAGGGGALFGIAFFRRVRAANPALYPTANPAAARRARRLVAVAVGLSLLLIGGLAALLGTGHPLIAAVGVISYFVLAYPVPLAVLLIARRRHRAQDVN